MNVISRASCRRIMADSSREYFRGDNNLNLGGMNGTAPQWGAMKPGPPVTGSYYPYEWKVDDKKQAKQQTRGIGTMSTVNLSTVDIKHVAQQPQVINQQNAWGGTGATVAAGTPDAGWSTIKWENSNTMVQKPSTINTAGLQFVSAPAQPTNVTMNVIHGGRKTNPIIETFKCEVCNQVVIIKNRKSTVLF